MNRKNSTVSVFDLLQNWEPASTPSTPDPVRHVGPELEKQVVDRSTGYRGSPRAQNYFAVPAGLRVISHRQRRCSQMPSDVRLIEGALPLIITIDECELGSIECTPDIAARSLPVVSRIFVIQGGQETAAKESHTCLSQECSTQPLAKGSLVRAIFRVAVCELPKSCRNKRRQWRSRLSLDVQPEEHLVLRIEDRYTFLRINVFRPLSLFKRFVRNRRSGLGVGWSRRRSLRKRLSSLRAKRRVGRTRLTFSVNASGQKDQPHQTALFWLFRKQGSAPKSRLSNGLEDALTGLDARYRKALIS